MAQAQTESLDDIFARCRDMDASLNDRLDAFASAVRTRQPAFHDAVERLVARLRTIDAGGSAPKPGEPMPDFLLPDETGRLVGLAQLIEAGPVAVTFHRGHWCPYCRISLKALVEAQDKIVRGGGQVVAIMPDLPAFAATFKAEAHAAFPVLTDIDNGYAMSLNLAIWIGEEMERMMAGIGRALPAYQGNDAWLVPIPATFVVGRDGIIAARFIDPDYRKRVAVDDLLAALRAARF
jgi:peroxiredoxin